MALPINIEDLLNQRKVESNRIEFKKGWNPEKIYRSICGFANDFDNIGGGYILVGVEEENGIAKRPVAGLQIEQIDSILKEIINFNNSINPFYLPRTEIAEVDGKNILAIWCPSGINRPYDVPDNVGAKNAQRKHYIRSGSSTIEAKGYVLDELREMANRVPFDDRGNPDIKLSDISAVLVLDYLKKVNSKLASDFCGNNLEEILEQMELFVGPKENRMLKNVAAMMFCDFPEKFFPVTQVDIVHFPEGSVDNPDIMIEAPKMTGPVSRMINDALSYLRTNVIKQRITKPSDTEKSDKVFNYPYQALEEAVVNALYHRDYTEREPVEITIEPTHIDILSYTGPDRSISIKAIKEAKKLKARRYRNRRLGDFLKELGLTEGRATGIPTIQKHLKLNGNAPATIETDDDRTYFLMTIPCREDMVDFSEGNAAGQKVTNIFKTDISARLEDELKNNYLQVYLADIKDIATLKSGLENIISQVYLQVWEKARTDRALLIADVVKTFLKLNKNSTTSHELLKSSNVDSLYKLRRYILEPAISTGYIRMSEPDKPRSSKQEYLLTKSGQDLFNR